MAMSRGPHVRDLFIGHQAAFDYDEKESKKSYSITKKGKGPAPHPKLGAYKPKILSEDKFGDIPLIHSPKRDTSSPPPHEGQINKAFIIGDKDVPLVLEPIVNKPFIIGDKDVPMVLDSNENIYSEIQDVATPASRNTRQQTTNNPIFSDSSPEHQGNVYRDNYPGSRSVARDTILEEIEGVAIPPPDYEEGEMTLDFGAEDSGGGKDKPLHHEFAGEDFSRYLSDEEEDYEFDDPYVTARYKPAISRTSYTQNDKKSKTEAWRGGKTKRDSSKSLFKQNVKTSGKASLRKFSVSDTKLGIGMDGKSKKQPATLRDGVKYESSYESFLLARNGGPHWGSLESTSSDSGHETGDDVIRSGHGHKKSNPFWKKLTIKMKKTGYELKH